MIPRFDPILGFGEFIRIFAPSRKSAPEMFEEKFAKEMNQNYALAFPYGRTALAILIEALGIKDKEVIIPAYTCIVVPHAVIYSGNSPVFVDSSAEDYNMDFDLIESAISEQTAAIIATSIFGNPINLDKIKAFKRKYPNIHIIQDCAHSYGAEWKGEKVNIEGIAAIYGLNISKIITSVFGGMLTTDSRELYLRIKSLRDTKVASAGMFKSIKRRIYLLATYIAFSRLVYFIINLMERKGLLNYFVRYFDENKVDMPRDYLIGMSNFEAEIGIVQLAKYKDIIQLRRRIGYQYDQFFAKQHIAGKTFSHYPILVRDRREVLEKATKLGYQLGTVINYSCNIMKVYSNCRFYSKADNVSFFRNHVINLPMVKLDFKSINTLVDLLRPYLVEKK
jgi:dTDP-4-amino-4,6-dideoxygalactose transaminase